MSLDVPGMGCGATQQGAHAHGDVIAMAMLPATAGLAFDARHVYVSAVASASAVARAG